ncbi:MBL fold metallo-hydrolase [Corynebacterium caspium]|uniref:MBL fold metallo-hydrolase n=1 Tax=Corynebacterium caspium TaxID=234828 RepID=UPI00058E6893|nr:MBL fold metallo-hydrolase [Corynebacterium caspium]WKD58795.1 ribonuclease Z [Corynebacterium caspium DSM 44850]
MKMTILGSSGSLGGPWNAASGYLVEPAISAPGIVMDLGPGSLAQLARYVNPAEVHIALSHLHADHCLDFPSLLVWRRFHPKLRATQRHKLLGPSYTLLHMGRICSDDQPEGIEDISDSFNFSPLNDGISQEISGLQITPFRVVHPIEAYAFRIYEPNTGVSIAYSGDSAWSQQLITAAQDVDIFFCEATWGATANPEVPGMHLSGAEAGKLAQAAGAKKLVLVHIPPWVSPHDCVAAAREHYSGPVSFGAPGTSYQLGKKT